MIFEGIELDVDGRFRKSSVDEESTSSDEHGDSVRRMVKLRRSRGVDKQKRPSGKNQKI